MTQAAEQLPTGRIYKRGECEYGKLHGVNFSTLKELRRSPKHYRHRLVSPREATSAMALGTAAHIAVLEPERFLKEFVLWDQKTDKGRTRPRNGKDWDDFEESARATGKQVLRVDEYDTAITLRDAVRDDDVAMKYLAMGKAEIALQWVHEPTGTPCKGRVDWATKVDGGPCIVDLKSARDVSPHWFSRAVAKLDYHVQLAFYADGYEAATGIPPRVVVVAVESGPPHDVVVYIVPSDVLQIGREVYGGLLDELKRCSGANDWPGHGQGVERTLNLPAWAVPDDEDGLDDLGLTGWK
jgi:hypothetical protein